MKGKTGELRPMNRPSNRLYHVPLSPFCRKVRLTLAEKKIEAELVEERYWEPSPDFLRRNPAGKVPILGVCLGHQAIGEAFGGKVSRAPYLMHGKTAEICHDSSTIFHGLPYRCRATRYHSLIVEKDGLPDDLEVSATTPDGLIMGLRHKRFPVEGVQFHPESVMTEHGKTLLQNFLKL